MSLLARVVRGRFALTSRDAAEAMIHEEAARSVELTRSVSPEQAAQGTRVKSMLGVDEDMRDWSLCQVLEHNTIVNRAVCGVINHLANGAELPAPINPKTDVMPQDGVGLEQIEPFEASVADHLAMLAETEKLKGTEKRQHPIFGMLDAHGWNCMFGFHLQIHRKQMDEICRQLNG